MKKIISIILMCAALCMISGCNRAARVVDALNWELNASEIAKEQASIILDCLKTGNSEKLEEQFCENISSTHDLKAEIAEAIEFIDGNIIDDGHWIGMSSGEEAVDNGVITKLIIFPTMLYVKTAMGKEYDIAFTSYLVYEKDSGCLGMTCVKITCGDSNVEIGGSPY